MAAVALVAGAAGPLAARLGVSMTLLQLGIGTLNDVVDAPFDTGRKPGKPIAAGLVPARGATFLAIACLGGGAGLALSVSGAVAVLAGAVIAIGLSYDLRLKGTAWSWLPFAVGIPILPVYGWLGATGTLDPTFLAVVPAAVLAGAALAIANSLVDVERDRAAGRSSVAAALGPRRARGVACALLAAVALFDGAALVVADRVSPAGLGSVAAVAFAAVVTVAGGGPGRAERAWQATAISLGAAAIAFLLAVLD